MYVGIGTETENKFASELRKYGIKKIVFAPKDPKKIKEFLKQFKHKPTIIIGVHGMTGYPTQNFGLELHEIQLVNTPFSKQPFIDRCIWKSICSQKFLYRKWYVGSV